MILFYPIIKGNIKRPVQSGRNSVPYVWDEKGKLKSKIDYYTFHQTFVFPQNQLLPWLQQHWCWRLPGSGCHCHTESKVCRLYLDNSLFPFDVNFGYPCSGHDCSFTLLSSCIQTDSQTWQLSQQVWQESTAPLWPTAHPSRNDFGVWTRECKILTCAIPTTGSGGYFFPIQRANKKQLSPKTQINFYSEEWTGDTPCV